MGRKKTSGSGEYPEPPEHGTGGDRARQSVTEYVHSWRGGACEMLALALEAREAGADPVEAMFREVLRRGWRPELQRACRLRRVEPPEQDG